jgi:Ca2+-binding RTX toxin-like protein
MVAWAVNVRRPVKRLAHRRHRTTRMLIAIAGLLVLGIPGTSSAGVGSTCSFDEPTGLVSVDVAADDLVTLARSGDALTLDGAACQAATVTNTDLVEVNAVDMAATEIVVIDLSGGPLAPGSTDEADGSSEIEMDVDLKDMVEDAIRVVGTPGEDAITAGSHVLEVATLNLNADESVDDADVIVSGFLVSLDIHGHGGRDRLALSGPEGFSSFGLEVLHGGPGADDLIGVLEFEDSELDGGTGRDTADYSMPPEGYAGDAFLIWEEEGAEIGEDILTDIEVAKLGSDDDSVVYIGGATGETYGGDGHDNFAADGGPGAGDPGRRILHGGPGADQISVFGDQPLVVDLDEHTFRGAWYGSYSSMFAITTGGGDDRVIARRRLAYPVILTEGGVDVLDLRQATQRMFVASSGETPPDDGRRWLRTFAERVLGSGFSDILRGDGGANELLGFAGNDVLSGRGGNDFLAGGIGNDELRGGAGDDACLGGPGQDDVSGCAP